MTDPASTLRLTLVAAAAIGLILFVAFVVARLLRATRRGISIRMQVFLALAFIVGAFAFGLGLMVIDRIEARAVRLADQAARDEAASIAGVLEGEVARDTVRLEDLAARLEAERARGASLRIELLDARGGVLFPAGEPSAAGRPGTVHVDAPVRKRGDVVGAVRVVKPTVVMQQMLADFAPTVLVISLVLGAAAALAAMWIGRAISEPIERLSAFAERVSSGERTAAPPAVFGREVMRLSRSIDSMRRDLEGRPFVETFAADLSHELKNPVAAVRASAELLEEGALDDPEAARRFVTRIRESTERIERLLADLLGLARIEARGIESFAPIDLGRVARDAIAALDVPPGRLRLTTEGDVRVRGDASWLGRAITNLVDNALAHGAAGGAIAVRVARAPRGVTVVVTSRGAVEPNVRKRVFRRFVTTRAERGGTGLGLAIVRAIAEAHGGAAELAAAGPPAVEFRLVLPPAPLLAPAEPEE
ncbi:MAG: two-component sensor histidine kinase [Polyangiaceae bacterium]|nr:two-component sensor histidine kinase [Polyangiaceae bacterium]